MGQYVNFQRHSWDSFQAFHKEAEKPPLQLFAFIIERNEDKKIIGFVNHLAPNTVFRSPIEIGYAITEPALRGKGYASEAARLMVDYLFSSKDVERLQATTATRNLASQRILEKLSFRKEGFLRSVYFINGHYEDIVMFSLLRQEWEATKNAKT